MTNPADISRQFGDRAGRPEPQKATRKKKPSDKPRQPRAGIGPSTLGQRWYDLGEAQGFEFPYDANYFALALEKKISKDPRLQKVAGDGDKLDRWVTKMIEVWWGTADEDGRGGYFTHEITPRNAKEYFLVNDWDDVRDYAHSCLRAAYLKEHGRRVAPPEYPNQQAYQKRLEDVQKEHRIRSFVSTVDLEAEPPKVDEEGRARLRSWRDRKRQEKK